MKSKQNRSVMKKMAERIKNREPEELNDEDQEPLSVDGKKIPLSDPDYNAELQYDGYGRIDEYDGDVLNSNVDLKPDYGEELDFAERPADGSLAEESFVDKQEHHK